jgi:hypothetical protein
VYLVSLCGRRFHSIDEFTLFVLVASCGDTTKWLLCWLPMSFFKRTEDVSTLDCSCLTGFSSHKAELSSVGTTLCILAWTVNPGVVLASGSSQRGMLGSAELLERG